MAGAPLSIAMVMGDFDLSGIGTVTHVEGNRVYGFGHPMFSLGTCDMPMMTGFIHTVYPRASVSMKMGSPLRVVGVIDTDVSTGVAGRIGPKPDMLPVSVRVKTGRYADSRLYKVQMIREPVLLPSLLMSVLTSAIDTEGNLPEELTARLSATFQLKGYAPIAFNDTFSGPRYTGQTGAAALFSPLASIANLLVRNPMAPVRIEAIDCEVEIEPGRKVAAIESVRLLSDTIEPGKELKAFVTLKPYKGERETVELVMTIPDDFPEGAYEAVFSDVAASIRRRFRNDPPLAEPRDLAGFMKTIRMQTEPKRTAIYVHVPTPERGLAVQGQELPNLPGSVRAAFASQEGVSGPADSVGPDHGQPDLMGRRGLTDPAVHGGQGCRNLAIVEVMGPLPSSTRDEDDMKHRVQAERCARSWSCPVAGHLGDDGNAGGCGCRLGQARYLATGGGRGVLQASPRARGDLGPGARPLGAGAAADRAAGRRAGVGPCPRQ